MSSNEMERNVLGVVPMGEDGTVFAPGQADSVVILVDQDGVFHFMNALALNKTGWDSGGFAGKTMWDAFPKALADRQMESIREVIRSGRRVVKESQTILQGRSRWHHTNIYPVSDLEGNSIYALVVTTDVDELQRAQDELKQHLVWQTEVFEQSRDAVFISDMDSRMVAVNKAACEMTGYSREELLTMPLTDIHGGGDGHVLRRYREHIEQGKDATLEVRFRRKDGAWIDLEISTRPIVINQTSYRHATARDVTERRRVEEALRESEERFRQLTESIREVFWLIRPNPPELLYLSPAYEEIWGRPSTSVRKDLQFWFETIHPDDLLRVQQEIMGSAQRETCTEYRIIRPDGSIRWIRDRAFPIRGENGEIYRIAGIAEDITLQTTSEDALRESERRYRMLFETMADGVVYVNIAGEITSANPAAQTILGVPLDEMQARVPGGETWKAIYEDGTPFSPEDHPCMRALRTGQAVRNVCLGVFNPIKGKHRWLDLNAIPKFRPGENKPYGVCVTFSDITERKQAEEALRESKDYLDAVINAIGDPVIVKDREHRIILVNDAFGRMAGCRREDIVGRIDYDFFPKEEVDVFWARDNHVFATGEEDINEEVITDAALGPRTLLTKKTLYTDKHGKQYIVAVIRDISHRKVIEEALQASESRYRLLAENVSDVISVFDMDLNLRYVSPSVMGLAGLTPEECMTWDIRQMLTPDSYNKAMDAYGKVLSLIRAGQSNRIGTQLLELEANRKDGSMVWVEVRFSLLRNFEGRDISWLCVTRDISERKRVAAEISEFRDNMARAEQLASVGTLGATFAHQINQPLTAIRLFLQQSLRALRDVPVPEGVLLNLQDSLSEVSNAINITGQFLRFSRKMPKDKTAVDLADAARRVASVLTESARRLRMELSVNLPEGFPPIRANVGEMEQIFFILTENAIQAAKGRKGCRLRICGRQVDDQIELCFEDTCGGVAPEHLDRLFEPFFTTKHPDQGTGLGLPILQRIVSMNGGRVRVESEAGKGTTFYVTLPIGAAG